MFRIQPIEQLPGNFQEFVEEIAEGLGGLYGPAAAGNYRRVAPMSIRAALSHPEVQGFAAVSEKGPDAVRQPRAAGLLLSVTKQTVGQVSFLHVLREFVGQSIESQLLYHMVARLREEKVSGIVCESLPMTPIDLNTPFGELGFRRIERLLMLCELKPEGLARPSLRESEPLAPGDFEGLAEVIVDAYEGHPGRLLHSEVRTVEGALGFLQSACGGGYGPGRPSFRRVIRRDGRIVAGVVGCEIAPGVGFVLQLIVARRWQGQGLGTILLRDVAQCFHESGLKRAGLGVTATNPARRLYERLGFSPHRAVNAYVWWDKTPNLDRV